MRIVNVEQLCEDLRSRDWQTATRAASALRDCPGARVTGALMWALDAHDTAVTLAAAESLIARDEPFTADVLLYATAALDDDVSDAVWDAVGLHPDASVSREMSLRHDEAPQVVLDGDTWAVTYIRREMAVLEAKLTLIQSDQDWGIVNADGERLEQFAAFYASTPLSWVQGGAMVELLLASGDERLRDDPVTI